MCEAKRLASAPPGLFPAPPASSQNLAEAARDVATAATEAVLAKATPPTAPWSSQPAAAVPEREIPWPKHLGGRRQRSATSSEGGDDVDTEAEEPHRGAWQRRWQRQNRRRLEKHAKCGGE